MPAVRKDNSLEAEKVALRQLLVELIDEPPVICETHGGWGVLYARVYHGLAAGGVVFEKDEAKAAYLARQRPAWAVYEADVDQALAWGVGAHLTCNVLDLDPYGSPWPTIEAFMASARPRAPRLWVVVNDGLRKAAHMGRAWSVGALEEAVAIWGSENIHDQYLEVCRWMLEQKAALAGYRLDRFSGYYCGSASSMTHYLALLILADKAAGPP